MSKGVNKVILLGNVGKELDELKYTTSNHAIVNLSIATSERWKDKQTGENKERTEWHRIVLFGKLAEFAKNYIKKGSKVYLEGKLQTRKWQDKDGQDRYTTEIVADSFQLLDKKIDSNAVEEQKTDKEDDFSDEIPF